MPEDTTTAAGRVTLLERLRAVRLVAACCRNGMTDRDEILEKVVADFTQGNPTAFDLERLMALIEFIMRIIEMFFPSVPA